MSDLQMRMDILITELRMMINPDDPEDQDVERVLLQLPDWHTGLTRDQYLEVRELLITACKKMLKREWDKVKDESVSGRV